MAHSPTIQEWFDPSTIAREYRAAWGTPGYIASLLLSLALLGGAIYINFWAINAATAEAGPQVQDLILSSFPAYDVDGLFIYGTFIAVILSVLVALARPRGIQFLLHGLILFIVVRSGFTLLTHLGPPEAHYASDFGTTITDAFFGSDQFFSGHTGMTFLGALAYWRVHWLRNAFLTASAYFVAIVLLGHIHYSIDVASAFFITYGIFKIARWAFEREYRTFQADIESTTAIL